MSKPYKTAIQMVANRNITIRTTLGHVIKFEKDVPINVPRMAIPYCLHRGVLPVDDIGDNTPDEEPTPAPKAPVGDDREQELWAAFDILVEKNDSSDFTAAGRPDLRALYGHLNWKPDAREVTEQWKKYREARATEE